jgi:MscS family membrane protein
MKSIALIVALLVISIFTQAKEYQQYTPASAIKKHLHYVSSSENYNLNKSAEVFNCELETAKESALQLKRFYDVKGIYFDFNKLSNDSNFWDSIAGMHHYHPIKNEYWIYLEKVNNKWMYSASTIEILPKKYDELYPWITDLLLKYLPKLGHYQTLGLQLWQILGFIIIFLTGIIIFKLFIIMFELVMEKLKLFSGYNFKDYQTQIHKAAKPFSLAIVFQIISVLLPALLLPAIFSKYALIILDTTLPFYIMLFLLRLLDGLEIYFMKIAEKTESTLDDQLIPLAKKTFAVLIIVGGVITILHNLGFNITALLAGVSIGGIAFALAAQDTLKNFFGSVMIFIDKPFQIGDYIKFSDAEGAIEEVGFRATRIRTPENSVVYVPNGKIADIVVNNLGLRKYRRFRTFITTTYDTPAAQIEYFTKGLQTIAEENPHVNKDMITVRLNELGSSSLNILFNVFFDVKSLDEELKVRHEILIEIIEWAQFLGVRFAFPTQTLHIEDFPEKKSLTPTTNLNPNELNEKLTQLKNKLILKNQSNS